MRDHARARGPRRALLAFIAVAATLLAAPAAQAAYAPPDAPGPALSVPDAQLRASLSCPQALSSVNREAVLLVPGTALDPAPNFDWNYERSLAANGIPFCTVTLPQHTLGDIQVAAEYIVHAIRSMRAATGRKVQILGYSQGGMVPRWALRFWPDTRAMVDDDIGLDASNHGTDGATPVCTAGCQPAVFQQATKANFIAALNSFAETFSGIDYTEIYSRSDEVVTPNMNDQGSSSLRTGSGRRVNVATQEVCPTNTADHLAMGSYDPVGYALAIDALTHTGPVDPVRVDRAVCAQPFQPGVDPATFPANFARFNSTIAASVASVPPVPAEPPLACYVTASCPRGGGSGSGSGVGGRLVISSRPVRLDRRGRAAVRVSCRTPAGCRGTLGLATARAVRVSSSSRQRIVALGRASFSLSGASKRGAVVRVPLTRSARGLVRRLRRVAVRATAQATVSAQARGTVRSTLRLRG